MNDVLPDRIMDQSAALLVRTYLSVKLPRMGMRSAGIPIVPSVYQISMTDRVCQAMRMPAETDTMIPKRVY